MPVQSRDKQLSLVSNSIQVYNLSESSQKHGKESNKAQHTDCSRAQPSLTDTRFGKVDQRVDYVM